MNRAAKAFVVAALTAVMAQAPTQCGESPRGNKADCPRPQPITYAAGTGEVIDRLYRTHPGCTDKWFLKVQEDSNGREVWFETSADNYLGCTTGTTWKPSLFGSTCA